MSPKDSSSAEQQAAAAVHLPVLLSTAAAKVDSDDVGSDTTNPTIFDAKKSTKFAVQAYNHYIRI
jgi:hypothetical protein